MSKNDLQSDLLADLQIAANARPLPTAPPVVTPPLDLPQLQRLATPAFDIRVTPLSWARPGRVSPEAGLGLGVRVGPFQVSLTLGG